MKDSNVKITANVSVLIEDATQTVIALMAVTKLIVSKKCSIVYIYEKIIGSISLHRAG